jgi:hypothetical protein
MHRSSGFCVCYGIAALWGEDEMTMINGTLIKVKLFSDDNWYHGVVVNPRKEAVQLCPKDQEKLGFEIADETCIEKWEIETITLG